MAEKEKELECTECGDSGIGFETSSKLWVKDRFVDAVGMDDIMEQVFHMRLKDRKRITEELMIRYQLNNQIEGSLRNDYRLALIDEYERRQLPYL